MKSLTLAATVDNIPTVTDFVDQIIEDCPMKAIVQVNLAIDEIFGNIAHYAYPNGTGNATVSVDLDDLSIKIVFSDEGVPFDPLQQTDPDIEQSVEERSVGGLGIFMVKKIMDFVEYEYREGKNILSIVKKLT